MDDIKVASSIDLKTYYRISLLVYFKLRTIIILLIAVSLIGYYLITSFADSWISLIAVLLVLIFYAGLLPFSIYKACKRNMMGTAYLNEPISYTINKDQIAYKGITISATSNWQYISKLIERENYFLLMSSPRSFHFLPKTGFESGEEINRFKSVVREKAIKMTYN